METLPLRRFRGSVSFWKDKTRNDYNSSFVKGIRYFDKMIKSMHAVSNAAATGSSELYFKELAIYITSVAKTSLKQNALGQRTIDLSLKMLSLSCNVFGGLELNRLNRVSRRDARLVKKIEASRDTHAVEDAMLIFKTYKGLYQETEWEKMIECKGRIIENMESDDE